MSERHLPSQTALVLVLSPPSPEARVPSVSIRPRSPPATKFVVRKDRRFYQKTQKNRRPRGMLGASESDGNSRSPRGQVAFAA